MCVPYREPQLYAQAGPTAFSLGCGWSRTHRLGLGDLQWQPRWPRWPEPL